MLTWLWALIYSSNILRPMQSEMLLPSKLKNWQWGGNTKVQIPSLDIKANFLKSKKVRNESECKVIQLRCGVSWVSNIYSSLELWFRFYHLHLSDRQQKNSCTPCTLACIGSKNIFDCIIWRITFTHKGLFLAVRQNVSWLIQSSVTTFDCIFSLCLPGGQCHTPTDTWGCWQNWVWGPLTCD